METLKEKIKALMILKIDSQSFPLNDKHDILNLRKLCMVELKLKKGSWSYTGLALDEILKEKNISIVDENPSSQVGDLKINVPPASKATQPAPAPPTPPTDRTYPTAPAQEAPKVLGVEVEKNNQDTLKEGFSFIGDIYGALGIIKTKDKQALPFEEMTEEQFREKADKYAERVGSYCYRHNIEIPWLIEVLSLVGTGVLLFVVPLIKTFYMKTEKDEMDETLKADTEKIRMEKQNESS